jgi:hypothetical protein
LSAAVSSRISLLFPCFLVALHVSSSISSMTTTGYGIREYHQKL